MSYKTLSPIIVTEGGTGSQAFSAYGVITGGASTTGPLISTGAGFANQVLISNGGVVAPSFVNLSSLINLSSGTGFTGTLQPLHGGTGITSITSHNIIVGDGTNPVHLVAPSATAGVAIVSAGAAADPAYGTVVVAGGGTGNTTFNAYSVICAGTTATGAFQNVTGVGSVGDVLASNGAAALPTWQALSGLGVTSVAGSTGGGPQIGAITLSPGTTGLTYTGAAGTITTAGTLVVSNGGTGASTLTIHGVLIGNTTSAVNVTAAGTNGQLLCGSTGNDPEFTTLTSTLSTIGFTTGAHTLALDVNTGFQTVTGWATFSGAGAYFDDTTLGTFQLLRGGTGYINGTPITFAAQNISGMTAGNTYYIYIDSTGTIGKTTTFSSSLFQDNIVLFECLRDSTPVTNNQITVKENHPYNFQPMPSVYLHNVIGAVIENNLNGANITLNGTQKIQINGDDVLADHGLYTDILDSAGVAVTFRKMYTTAAGKWATYTNTDTFTGHYNNAGTPAALSANRFAVYTLYVSKDNLNTTTPFYYAVLDTSQYNTLVAANNAISSGTTAKSTNELSKLETAQLGYIVYSEAAAAIVQVTISKSTLKQTLSTSGTNVAALINTNVTNFNNVLSSADTTVQSALDTIDDFGSGTGTQTVHLYDGAGIKTVTLGSTNTTSATTIQAGSTGLTLTTATANGPITVSSGTGTIGIATNATNNTINIATGAGIKVLTCGSANSTSSTTVQAGTAGMIIQTTGTLDMHTVNANMNIYSGTGQLNIGNDAAAQFIQIGTGAAAKSIYIGSNITTSQVTLTSGPTGSIALNSNNGQIQLASGTGIVYISHDNTNNLVNIADGAGVKAVTLGSTTSTSSTLIQSGSGALDIISTNGALTIKSGTGALAISNDAAATTVNLATGAAVKTVTLGSTNSTSATTVQAGSTGLTLTTATANGPITIASGTGQIDIAASATNSTLNVGTGAGNKVVSVGSTTGTSSLALKYGTADFTLASATGTVMSALDTGEITYPLQSAFSGYVANTVSNVTGDGTVYTIAVNAERFDQNSDFNTGTYTFTAPVTGRYFFTCCIFCGDISNAMTGCNLSFVTSNISYSTNAGNPYSAAVVIGGYKQFIGSVFADMDAADTTYITIVISGGTKIVDVLTGGADVPSYFQGYLVC